LGENTKRGDRTSEKKIRSQLLRGLSYAKITRREDMNKREEKTSRRKRQ